MTIASLHFISIDLVSVLSSAPLIGVIAQVVALESDCIRYLHELAALPFYPAHGADCAGDKAFFCDA